MVHDFLRIDIGQKMIPDINKSSHDFKIFLNIDIHVMGKLYNLGIHFCVFNNVDCIMKWIIYEAVWGNKLWSCFKVCCFCISWKQKNDNSSTQTWSILFLIFGTKIERISNGISPTASFYVRIQSKQNLLSSSIFVSILICISFCTFITIYISKFWNHIRTIPPSLYIHLIMSDQKGTLRLYNKTKKWKIIQPKAERTNIPKQTRG